MNTFFIFRHPFDDSPRTKTSRNLRSRREFCLLRNHQGKLAVRILSAQDHAATLQSRHLPRREVHDDHDLLADHIFRRVLLAQCNSAWHCYSCAIRTRHYDNHALPVPQGQVFSTVSRPSLHSESSPAGFSSRLPHG